MPRITIYTPSDIDTIPADALKKLAMKTLIYEEKERARSKLYYVVHSRFSGTRVSRARAAMRTRYPDRIGDRTIVREILNVLVRCMMCMGDVAK